MLFINKHNKKILIFFLIILSLILIDVIYIGNIMKYKERKVDCSQLTSFQIDEIIDSFDLKLSETDSVSYISKITYKNGLEEYLLELQINNMNAFYENNVFILNWFPKLENKVLIGSGETGYYVDNSKIYLIILNRDYTQDYLKNLIVTLKKYIK